MASTVWKTLMRRKIIQQPEETSLGRVLNTWDLTFLGVGATLGIGLYVLVGKVARETAGPSIVLSFLIAAVASGFAGLCYAEFGARVPRAGSAYVYSYVCVGELVAFIIGWNLILEYVIGAASVAHGMSLYIDTITNDSLKRHFVDIAPIYVSFLAPYFDFFAFGTAIILSIGLALGVKESTYLNNIITVLNMAVVIFVFIAGGLKAKWSNWSLPAGAVTTVGKGGFFPFGITGMIKGAATCFYGFVGFDCIATTGEEAKNPRKSIPLAILVSLCISVVAYCGTSAVVTLMIPYYDQDIDSPIPHAFAVYGMDTAKWVVTIGGLFALSASLFGAMFPLPRIIYAMASDGLIFRVLGKVNARFATPLIGTLLAGLLTGILGGLFEQRHLIDMMSIGTLMAYTIVAACVLILRYSVNVGKLNPEDPQDSIDDDDIVRDKRRWLCVAINSANLKHPNEQSQYLVSIQVAVFGGLAILAGLCAKFLPNAISDGEVYAIVLTAIVVSCMMVILISMCLQPQNNAHLSFKVPLVPIIPCLSILVNIYLMMALDASTWIRFGIWMAIGLPIYWCSMRPYCGGRPEQMPIGCGKARNMSEGSTYVNFGFINGDGLEVTEMVNRETQDMEGHRRQQKEGADSDSGAYFEDNEQDTEQSTPEAETSKEGMVSEVMLNYANVRCLVSEEVETASVQDALESLDTMLEKEEEKCADIVQLGAAPSFRNRSVSIVSSVSNNSNNLPLEVSVIAIVHHEDDREPIIEEVENLDETEESETLENSEVKINEARNTVLLPKGVEVYRDVEDPITPPPPPTPLAETPSVIDTPLPPPPPFINLAPPPKRKAPPPPIKTLPDINAVPPSPPEEELSLPPPPPPSMLEFELFKADSSTSTLKSTDSSTSLPPPPPPPPPSMSQFEIFKSEPNTSTLKNIDSITHIPPPPPLKAQSELFKTDANTLPYKDVDFSLARATLKKSARPITPPPSASSTPLGTPTQHTRRLTPSKSDTDLYTPSEDNIKLSSHDVLAFKDKLAANLGNMPKNLKFNVTPAPSYQSLDRPPLKKKPTNFSSNSSDVGSINSETTPKAIFRRDSLSASNPDVRRKNSSILDESLKSVNKAAIMERLTVLYNNRGEDQNMATPYRNRKKPEADKDKNEFGETIA